MVEEVDPEERFSLYPLATDDALRALLEVNDKDMTEKLTSADIAFILTSLDYTRLNFQDTNYPTAELRQQRFDELDRVVARVRAIRDSLTESR